MESILNFLSENYLWFLVAAVILGLALIGFIAEAKKKEKNKEELSVEETPEVENAPLETEVVNEVQEQPTFEELPSEETMVEEPVVEETIDLEQTPTEEPFEQPFETISTDQTPEESLLEETPEVTTQTLNEEPVNDISDVNQMENISYDEPIINVDTPLENTFQITEKEPRVELTEEENK